MTQNVSEFGPCFNSCGRQRYSKRRGLCRECVSEATIQRKRMVDEGLVTKNSPTGPQYPARRVDQYQCNHCALVLDGIRALIAHKSTHNHYQRGREEYSLMPSSQSWIN